MSDVQASRRVAYEVLRGVSSSEAYANLLLPAAMQRAGLTAGDAGLATELTYGTLRKIGTYDAVISRAADRPTNAIKPGVLDALRLAVHQLFATRVATHAAVHESVNLAREAGGQKAAGFANAVLRRIAATPADEWLAELAHDARSDDEELAVLSSHPVWIIRAFRRALAAEGRAEELEALLAADNASPQVTMAALPGLAEIPEAAERTPYSPVGFRNPGGAPDALVRKSNGTVRVQDEGSQLVALALAEGGQAGERWLDLCAGPGGKTALLAARALEAGATVDANEITPSRAGLVRDSVAGVPLKVTVAEEDGRDFAAAHTETYDRILVDAPCTGLGALRRRPEARWRKQPSDVSSLVDLQSDLVLAAFEALRPGGVLAYVTCSPHLAETTGVVREALQAIGDRGVQLDAKSALRAVTATEIDLGDDDEALHAQLWPHRHGTDAMFLALIQKR